MFDFVVILHFVNHCIVIYLLVEFLLTFIQFYV